MNIVGLGKAGCAIADKFAEYPQYKIYKIDVGAEGDFDFLGHYGDAQTKEKKFNIKEQSKPEEYEKNTPSMKAFFSDLSGEVLFVVCGAGLISGMTLAVLEQLKAHDVAVLYIRPDINLLSQTKSLQERVAFNVLQQYTRSGLLKRMYIVSNSKVEEIMGDVPIIGYYDMINGMIVSCLHMINVFVNAEPVLGRLEAPGETARIATFGFLDLEKDQEKMLFSLDKVRECCYIYSLNEGKLRESTGLHKQIIKQVKSKKESGDMKISYGVYPTKYDNDFAFCIAYSSTIQGEN